MYLPTSDWVSVYWLELDPIEDHEDRSEELSHEYVYVSSVPSLSASVTVAVRVESSATVPEIATLPTSLTLVTVTVNEWVVSTVPSFAVRTTELAPKPFPSPEMP